MAPNPAQHGSRRLLEREDQLDAVSRLLEDARSGNGGAIGFRAPAGAGKTRLREAAYEHAVAGGMAIAFAQGSRLARNDAWGVARLLLRSLTGGSAPSVGPAVNAFDVLGAEGASAPQAVDAAEHAGRDVLRVAHDFTSLVLEAAAREPLCVVVGDAHWADHASLGLLAHLAARVGGTSLALLVTARPDADDAQQALLEQVFGDPSVRVLPLPGLSLEAVTELIGDTLPGEDAAALAEEALELSVGNPFLVDRLIRAAETERASRRPAAGRLAELVVPTLDDWLALRLADAGPGPAAVARAAAVLGDASTIQRVSRLTDTPVTVVAAAADVLTRVGLLEAGEPLRFVHPLVARAMHDALPSAAAADAHERAAWVLRDDGAGAPAVAAHLMRAPRRARKETADQLVAAAGQALRVGEAPTAVRLLERALVEPPPAAERADLVINLAAARAAAGDPSAGTAWAEAIELLDDPLRRAEVRRAEGRWLVTTGRARDAARAYLLGRADLQAAHPDHPLDAELQAAYLQVALFDLELRPLAERETAALLDAVFDGRSAAERTLLAQLAYRETLAAAPRTRVRALCDRAWSAGALLADETADGTSWTLVAGSLYWTGELERALEVVEAAGVDAERRASPLAQATVAWCGGPPRLHRGEITLALEAAEAALGARELGWGLHLGSLHRLHARCLIERGELAAAAATIDEAFLLLALRHSKELAGLHEVRGRLKLLAGDYDAALDDFEASAELVAGGPLVKLPSVLPWRSSSALALHGLGRRDEALERLEEELALAARAGVDGARSTVLRIRGLVLGGEEGLASLAAAVDVMAGPEPRLERTYAQVEMGAALRRANRRRDAEGPLRSALAAAQAGGALMLADRAHTELAALGRRVRRADADDGDVLTASERRVALLAIEGRTNKEIAAVLYVTTKTVEFHLGQAFRKLQIRRRGELRAALSYVPSAAEQRNAGVDT